MSNQQYLLSTLENAFRILDVLAETEEELGLSELSRMVGLPKATTYRLLVTLQEYEYIRQNEESSNYTLGLRLWELGRRAVDRLELRSVAHKWLEKLHRVTKETVMLVILEGSLLVYVEKLDTPQPIQINPRSLGIAPLHASASGKVFLAYESKKLEEHLEGEELTSYTAQTISNRTDLESELVNVREQGWAISRQEWKKELVSLGAPVWGANGNLAAVVTIAGPTERFPSSRDQELLNSLLDTTQQISNDLGYRGNYRKLSLAK